MNPTGDKYLTGGEFGLEGSVLSVVLFVVLVVWLLWKKVLEPADEVATMWADYPEGFGLHPPQPTTQMQDTRYKIQDAPAHPASQIQNSGGRT